MPGLIKCFCVCVRFLIFALLINVTNEINFKHLQHFKISFSILHLNGRRCCRISTSRMRMRSF